MISKFPVVDYSTGFEQLQRQRSHEQIERTAARLGVVAHEAHDIRLRATTRAHELQAYLQRNVELAFATAARVAGYVLLWLAPFAALAVDYVLLGSVLEYFARRVYTDPEMVTVTRIIIPMAIVTVEMIISAQRVYAQEQALESGHSHSHWIWHLFPMLMIVPLPILVVATNIAAAGTARTPTFDTILKLEIVGLVALSVVMHGIILYGGQMAAEARAYFFLQLKLWRGNYSLKRLRQRFKSTIVEMLNVYRRHVRLVNEQNDQHGLHLQPGPFDLVTQELLAEVFGDPDQTHVEFPSRIDA